MYTHIVKSPLLFFVSYVIQTKIVHFIDLDVSHVNIVFAPSTTDTSFYFLYNFQMSISLSLSLALFSFILLNIASLMFAHSFDNGRIDMYVKFVVFKFLIK